MLSATINSSHFHHFRHHYHHQNHYHYIIITLGRQVTMYYLYDSLHRELDQTTEYSLRLDQYMYRLFSSGVSSGLDLVVLVAMMPSLLFAPSTWYTGGSHCLHEYM